MMGKLAWVVLASVGVLLSILVSCFNKLVEMQAKIATLSAKMNPNTDMANMTAMLTTLEAKIDQLIESLPKPTSLTTPSKGQHGLEDRESLPKPTPPPTPSKGQLGLEDRELLMLYASLYEKYAEELLVVRKQARDYLYPPGGKYRGALGQSDDVEMEVTYMRVRETRPKVLWEISPNQGYSTLWILSALRQNGNGAIMYSFDVHDYFAEEGTLRHHIKSEWEAAGWRLVIGDFQNDFKHHLSNIPVPDYLHLDSVHTAAFARFYTQKVFPSLLERGTSKGVYVALHDVFNPQIWSDVEPNLREIAGLPDWMANEEGQVVLYWMSFHTSLVCHAFTPSWAYDSKGFKELFRVRTRVIAKRSDYTDIWGSGLKGIKKKPNPIIFFQLGGC